METDSASIKIRSFIGKYLPYFPLLLLLGPLGAGAAWLYLRSSHFIYNTRAKIILSEHNKGNQSANEPIRISLNTNGDVNQSQENEIEVMHSKESMMKVVKNLGLYAEVLRKGRIVMKPFFGRCSPLFITSYAPDSIPATTLFTLRVDVTTRTVSIDGKTYPLNRNVFTPYGLLNIKLNPRYHANTKDNLYIRLTPVSAVAEHLIGSLRIVPKSKESSIVDINMQDELPERGMAVINETIHVYDSLTQSNEKSSAEAVIAFIDKRLALVADELNGVEKELENYKSKMSITNLPAEGDAYFEKVQDIDKEMALLDNQLKILNEVQVYLNSKNHEAKAIPAIVELNNTGLADLLGQLFQSEADFDKVDRLSGPANPQLVILKEHIDKLKPAVIESIDNLRKNYLITKRNYQSDISKYQAMLKGVPEKERKLIDITRRQEVKNAIYTFLLQKREETAVSAAANNENSQVLEKPEYAGLISPISTQVYMMFTLGGLALALAIAYLKESLNTKINSKADFIRVLPLPILGEIKNLDEMNKVSPYVIHDKAMTVISEQFRDLRTNMNYLTASENTQVILVTSSVVGEGKSFISLNMAASFALSGKKVILLEFDLRRPRISRQMGLTTKPGISNYLAGLNPLEDILLKLDGFDSLYLAPSGAIPPNPTELIMSKKATVFFDQLKKEYDCIVIDSPPVSAVTDAKVLSAYAGATAYVMRDGVTPIVFLRHIREMKEKGILPNLGLVFNGVKTKKFLGYIYSADYTYSQQYYGYSNTLDHPQQSTIWDKLMKSSGL